MATYGGWIEIWQILQKHATPSKGNPSVTEQANIYAGVEATHEVIWLPAYAVKLTDGVSVIAAGSEDGDRLEALGCYIDEDSDRWCHPG